MSDELIALRDVVRSSHSLAYVAADARQRPPFRVRRRFGGSSAAHAHNFAGAVGRRWKHASGLTLKESKCVFIPLWDDSVDEMRAHLRANALLRCARVEVAARYPGVTVGTDTRRWQWESVARKLRERAREIASCGATLPTRIQLYNIHGQAPRSIGTPDDVLLRAERVAAQRICLALWIAFPVVFLAAC